MVIVSVVCETFPIVKNPMLRKHVAPASKTQKTHRKLLLFLVGYTYFITLVVSTSNFF